MNRRLLLAVLAIAAFAGCQKKKEVTVLDETPFELRNVKSMYYAISNVDYNVPIRLVLFDSAHPHATFTVEAAGLPAGVSCNSVKVYSNDTFTLTLQAHTAVSADQSFSIRCSAPNRRTQNYSVMLRTGSDCANDLTGTWAAKDSGGISFIPATTSAYVSNGTEPGTINIDMDYRSHDCTLNCGDGTLTSVGHTSSSSYWLSDGDGKFTAHRIVVHYFMHTTNTYENWLVLTR